MAKRLTKGFTLIELLVVITIMMTMLALVSPLAINSINRVEAQDEYLAFCTLLRRASNQAFVNNKVIHVELSANSFRMSELNVDQIKGESTQRILREEHFDYLGFGRQIITFNHYGLPNASVIEFTQKDKSKALDLSALLKR